MLDGLTCIITGASSGIGREMARTFAAAGATVVIAARSDGIHETEAMIESDATLAVETDVSDTASVRACVDEAVATFGGLDCVVNNAAVSGPTAPVEETTIAAWEAVFDTNLYGAVRLVAAALPALRESEAASIINISSGVAKNPSAGRSAYAASKMALIGFNRILAVELGPDGITANTICPGAVEGDRLDDAIRARADRLGVSFDEAKQSVFLDGMALDEMVTAEDVAAFAAFLASPHARHITAQDINVSSGATWY